MDALTFLKGLPAILGVTGFFAYLWLAPAKIGGDLMKEIIAKLRVSPNIAAKDYADLTPVKPKHLLDSDERVRAAVNADDIRILELLVRRQFNFATLAFIGCAALIAWSVWLISRPGAARHQRQAACIGVG